MSNTLLPPNATPLELALEATTARISNVPILVRESWNPDTCPVKLLPWLAWAFSVDEWSNDWPEATKRDVIKAAYNVARIKGSVASIKMVLQSVGFGDAVLLEGAAAGGTWAEYKVTLNRLLTVAQVAQAQRIVRATAPKSRSLISFDFTGATLIYNGYATYDGTYTHGEI